MPNSSRYVDEFGRERNDERFRRSRSPDRSRRSRSPHRNRNRSPHRRRESPDERSRYRKDYDNGRYGRDNADPRLPPRLPGEDTRTYRLRIRSELAPTRSVWARSPSPPPIKKSLPSKKNIIKLEGKAIEKRKRSASTSSSSSSSSSSTSSSSSSSSSSSDSDQKKRRSKKKKRGGKSKQKKSVSKLAAVPALDEFDRREAERFKLEVQGTRSTARNVESDDDDFGPQPLAQIKEDKKMSYGGQMFHGEGEAIAQFVQQNLRIPRRGEIGWQGDDIERLEHQGYVMSGSRHKAMNAVRIRKENQVYSAEEKKALALITFEEKLQKENKIIGDFRMMLSQRQKNREANDSSGNESAN